jgi:hypothetical protein
MQTGRSERRVATNLAATIEAADEPWVAEPVVLLNVSEHGARLIASRFWNAGGRVVISDSLVNCRTAAQIVYCVPHISRRFAVGLKFTEHSALLTATERASLQS